MPPQNLQFGCGAAHSLLAAPGSSHGSAADTQQKQLESKSCCLPPPAALLRLKITNLWLQGRVVTLGSLTVALATLGLGWCCQQYPCCSSMLPQIRNFLMSCLSHVVDVVGDLCRTGFAGGLGLGEGSLEWLWALWGGPRLSDSHHIPPQTQHVRPAPGKEEPQEDGPAAGLFRRLPSRVCHPLWRKPCHREGLSPHISACAWVGGHCFSQGHL